MSEEVSFSELCRVSQDEGRPSKLTQQRTRAFLRLLRRLLPLSLLHHPRPKCVHSLFAPKRPTNINDLNEPFRERRMCQRSLEVLLERVSGRRRSGIPEREIEERLEFRRGGVLLLLVEFVLRHVEEVGEGVTVVDEEVLLDRSGNNVGVSGGRDDGKSWVGLVAHFNLEARCCSSTKSFNNVLLA